MSLTMLSIREGVVSLLEQFKNKYLGLKSLGFYDRPLYILYSYMFKRNSRISICIKGLGLCFQASPPSAIRRARLLGRYSTLYELEGQSIVVRLGDYSVSYNVDRFMVDDYVYYELAGLLTARRFGVKPVGIGRYFVVNYDGLRWHIRNFGNDLTAGPLLPYVHEPYEYENWFRPLLSRVSTFIDVGAYVGGYSMRACRAGVNTIAVEPSPSNFEILRLNAEANNCDKVSLLNVAAGDMETTITLREEYATSSISEEGVPVRAMPLDKLISDFLIRKPVMVKVDVEGFEEHVLEGMKELLKDVSYVFIEVTFRTRNNVHRLLRSYGFKLRDLKYHWEWSNKEKKVWNCLYVRD